MKKVCFFLKHILLAAVILSSSFYLAVYRKKCGAAIASSIREVEEKRPEILCVGNSVLKAALDEKALSRILGQRAIKVTSNGSASAWWYLYLKNVVLSSSFKPQKVVIFFRDHYLTEPNFRVEGKYQKPLRMLSQKEEPILAKKALKLSSSLGYAASEAKERFERRLVKITANLLRVNKNQVSSAMASVLGESAMIPELITRQQLASETVKEDDLDFTRKLPLSFLPEMITLAKESKVELIFVRCKRRRDIITESQSPQLIAYIEQLKSYLSQCEIFFIDMSQDLYLEEDFGPGDHLNERGRARFTTLMAERLM